MNLSDDEKAEVKRLIDAGRPLPDKYRWRLFETPRETELIWPGKTSEVTNVVLPFQTIEQIDEPRAETSGQVADLFQMGASGRQSGGWSNKLIWGDNKLVLASLKNGPLRKQIEDAGGLKLVYIDPPFDVGADFSVEIEVGDDSLTKEASVIEDVAYRDTWGRGADSYISMIYERLTIIHGLMSENASIYVHCDSRVNYLMRSTLEEIFGREYFINNLTWRRTGAHNDPGRYGTISDTIFFFSKSTDYCWNQPYGERGKESIQGSFAYAEGPGGEIARLKKDEEPKRGWRRFQSVTLRSPNPRPNLVYTYKGFRSHKNGWAIRVRTHKIVGADKRL